MVYYRLAYAFKALHPYSKSQYAKEDGMDKSAHFALMLVSLCALLGISIFLSLNIGRNLAEKLLSIVTFNYVMFLNDNFFYWILRPHPEFLLSFLVLISFFCTFRLIAGPNNKNNVVLSAIFWPLAASAKFTAIIFIPLVSLLWIDFKNLQQKLMALFIFTFLITYALMDFPGYFCY